MESIHTVYAGLGSNSPDAADRLLSALDALSRMPGTVVSALSPVYRTEPQDYADQPWFLNRVLMLHVSGDITPVELMKRFLGIEALLGRVRSPDPALRFGPRAMTWSRTTPCASCRIPVSPAAPSGLCRCSTLRRISGLAACVRKNSSPGLNGVWKTIKFFNDEAGLPVLT